MLKPSSTLPLLALLLAGCAEPEGQFPGVEDLMRTGRLDLASPADAAHPDLAGHTPDLAEPPPDLARGADLAQSPVCMNGKKDGMETDVDCGGPMCVKCAVGKSCLLANDCASGICTGFVCAMPPGCNDGVKNGAETDVDCGGGMCPACALGKACAVGTDCVSATCTGKVCVAPVSCTNGLKDGMETDVDCGGGVCPICPVGKTCGQNSDCGSKVCAAGRCGCPANTADCDNNIANGCETDITKAATCGACNNKCPGVGAPFSDATCADPGKMTCAFTCQGENYDYNGNAADGCEVPDSVANSHSMNAPAKRPDHDCSDGTVDTFSGTLPSDARWHDNPTVTNFDTMVGAAPDFYSVFATGGLTCVDDYSITFTTAGGGNVACYRLWIFTDKITNNVVATGNQTVKLADSSSARYSDKSTIYFKIEKTCSTMTVENIAYTVTFHL